MWCLSMGLQATDHTHLAYAFLLIWYVCVSFSGAIALVAAVAGEVVLGQSLSLSVN